jgi:hypothetical protein
MAVSETGVAAPPRWRRVVSALIGVYLVLSGVGFGLAMVFAAVSGSMDLQAGGSPGVLLSGTFTYRYHNAAKGRTVDIPATAPSEFTDPGRIVVGASDSGDFAVVDQSDFGPFGYAGRGYVTLPRGVQLHRELNATSLLQSLRTGSRQELDVASPVGWRGRLLVALPSVLIWGGLWVALVMFGTFVRTIVEGQPFHPGNPARLLWLAGALGVVVVADSWLRVGIVRVVLDVLGRHAHPIPLLVDNPGISTGPIVVIIGVLCLAAAFRAGTRMAADTEGLV